MSEQDDKIADTPLGPGQQVVVEVIDDDLVEVVRDMPADDQDNTGGSKTSGPHALFWISLALLVPSILAGAAVDGEAPGVALRSEWVWRAQVALVVFLLGYVSVILFWLAYHGKTVPRVELPSGTGLEVPDGGDLTLAAERTDTIGSQVRENQQRQNEVNRLLLRRVNDLTPPDDRSDTVAS